MIPTIPLCERESVLLQKASHRDPSEDLSPSILDVLAGHVRSRPDHPALIFDDGTAAVARWTYRELDEAVRKLAGALIARGLARQRIALLFGPGGDFVLAFLACLSIGGVAIPLAPIGRRRERVRNLLPVIEDCMPAALLLDGGMLTQYGDFDVALAAIGVACVRYDCLIDRAAGHLVHDWAPYSIAPDDLAVLQYTSGSTSAPKGVMISHRNIAANQAMIQRAFGHDSASNFVGWAPHFHDQGLFGNILQPLYLGATCVLTAPATFIRRPLVWLELIDRYRAHTSGGPNFAYELATEHARLRGLPAVDLSCWKVAFNGAEPIHARGISNFAATFAPAGFRPQAFFPCYGLAECTVVTVCGPRDTPPVVRQIAVDALGDGHVGAPGDDHHLLSQVCCGPAMMSGTVLVVDPQTRVLAAPGDVGEMWLAGPHVASGYWRQPEASARTFGARLANGEGGPWLRTGDLGFAMPEGYYIVGRIKDILIIRGRNYYPSDIEQIWSEVIGHAGQAIAAAFQLEHGGATHVVLVAEIDRLTRHAKDIDTAIAGFAAQVRARGLDRLDLSITDLVVIAPGGVPRTTSGKVRRQAARQMLLDGELPLVGCSGPLLAKLEGKERVSWQAYTNGHQP